MERKHRDTGRIYQADNKLRSRKLLGLLDQTTSPVHDSAIFKVLLALSNVMFKGQVRSGITQPTQLKPMMDICQLIDQMTKEDQPT